MRGGDGGPWKSLCSLPAFWVGLLYDQSALAAAWDLVKDWTLEEHQHLRDQVPKQALHTPFRGRPLNAVAARAVEIADAGLKARNRLDGQGDNESHILALLRSRVEREKCPAEYLLDEFHGPWPGPLPPLSPASPHPPPPAPPAARLPPP